MIRWSDDLTDNLNKENFTASKWHNGAKEYYPYLAFDNHQELGGQTGFQVRYPSFNDWLKIDFITKVSPSKVTIQGNKTDSPNLPKKIKILMSNDDTNYDEIDIIDNIKRDTNINEYTYKRPGKKYRYLKIEFMEFYDSEWCTIGQMQFLEKVFINKYLIKQDKDYYSIKHNFYNLGQPVDNIQLEQWYEKYGADDISILTTLLNSKEMVMNLDDTSKVWKTNKPIDFNDIKDNIDLIDCEESKSIKYSIETYKIYDLLEDEFEIMMYEPNGENIDNTKLEIKGKRKNIFDRFNLQNPELLVYTDNKYVEGASLEIEGIKQEDFKYQIKLDDEIIQDYGQFDYREINKEFMIPKEKIDAAKKGDKTHILTVTMQDKEDNETVANCDINIKTQRSFSRYFKPNVDYVHISGFPKVLSEITIQIIKRAKNESEFTCITNNTLVSMLGNELKICGNSFEGWIYEVRVWEKDKERQWTGVPLKGDEEGLIALYRMNELEGNICFDSTDNKLHGIYLGTQWSDIIPKDIKEGINAEITIKDEDIIVQQGKDYPYGYEITTPYIMVDEIHENNINNNIVEFEIDNEEYNDIKNVSLIG
ncbi:discoidin domain-containing protein [Clostridium sp. Marseille-QA1073]